MPITRDAQFYNVLGNSLGKQTLQAFVDDMFANKYNKPLFGPLFKWGTPQIDFTYEQIESVANIYSMATVTGYDDPAPLRATQGASLHTGPIPRMKHGFVSNEKEIRTQMVLLQKGAALDVPAMKKILFNSVDQLIGGNHNRLTFMALQAESKGMYTLNKNTNPDGLPLSFDFRIPDKNRLKAGFYQGTKNNGFGTKFAWTDSKANPIGDLQDMAQFAKDNFIPAGVFRMTDTKWRQLVNHESTKKQILASLSSGNITEVAANLVMRDSQVKTYLLDLGLPPIEVIDALVSTESYNKVSGQMEYTQVRPFEEGNVVLRPAGNIGEIKCAVPLLIEDPAAKFAFFDGGRTLITQTFDAKLKNQSIESELTALPVIDRPKQIIILDTTKKAS
jgi:hypothetical protein